jgi:hypothetical protein
MVTNVLKSSFPCSPEYSSGRFTCTYKPQFNPCRSTTGHPVFTATLQGYKNTGFKHIFASTVIMDFEDDNDVPLLVSTDDHVNDPLQISAKEEKIIKRVPITIVTGENVAQISGLV